MTANATFLPAAPTTPAAVTTGRLVGFVDRFEQGDGFVVVAGWIATADKRGASLPVMLTLGADRIRVERFFQRDDLARKGIADGMCSFVSVLRTDLKLDAVPPMMAQAADGLLGQLQSGYKAFRPHVPTATLSVTPEGRLSGRLIDPRLWLGRAQASLLVRDEIALPLSPLPLDLSAEMEIGQGFAGAETAAASARIDLTLADLEQAVHEQVLAQALEAPGLCNGRLASGTHPVELRVDGQTLAATEIEVCISGKGYIEAFRGSTVLGWAAGKDITRPAEIDLLWDGVRYVTIRAGEQREDLIRKKIVSQGGGFRFTFDNAPGSEGAGRVSAVLRESGIALGCTPQGTLSLPPVPGADTGFTHVHADAKNRPICIIVPIYNAASDLLLCLASLERRVTMEARLILVDDCSPDPEIGRILDRWEGRPNVSVIRNERNLGFSGSINAGIHAADRSDVVLLNSDTIVTVRWLEKLRQAAYSARNIATVTALSCNAGAFSVPEIGSNTYPDWLGPDAINRMIQGCAGVLYPEAPTGNGFCMYVRRDCLDAVGMLDAVAFPRGYGEENDFCMRAMRMGFRNIVDDRTYIYHKRSASFGNGEAKAVLYEDGRAIVTARYPEYSRLTSIFSEDPVFLSVRWRVRKALGDIKRSIAPPRPRVLFVISTQSGGTPQTNRDLMGELSDRYETWLLRCDARGIELSQFENSEIRSVEMQTFRRPIVMSVHRSQEYDAVVSRLLTAYAFEIVHIRHIAWHSLSLPSLCRALRIPVLFSFHDFYTVCPTVKLLDEENRFCGGRCTAGEGECKAELWPANQIPPLKHHFIHEWQARMNDALRPCDAFITTSPGAAELLRDILPVVAKRDIAVIPHGRTFESMETVGATPTGDEPLRVLMPGNINVAKGSALCEAVLAKQSRRKVEFHVLGDAGPLTARPGLVLHGRYKREEFGRKAASIRPHVGAVLSIWPETYCHTLTEMWAAGLPVVAVDLGAVGERIRQHGGGWLIPPEADAAEVNALLRTIGRGGAEFERKRAEVMRWQVSYGRFYGTRVMSDQYDLLYRTVVRERQILGGALPDLAVVAVVSQFLPGQAAPASAHVRIGETTRNDADRALLFRHYRSAAMLGEETGRAPSAILVQRDTLDPDDVDGVIADCQARDIRIVVDCDDDLLSVPEDKDVDGRYRDGRPAFSRLLAAADLVSVSTPALLDTFRPLCRQTVLVPNMLSARLWLPALPETSARRQGGNVSTPPVALYMGTVTHDADLQLLREPVSRIRARHPDFRLRVIGGQRDDEDWFERIEIPNEARDYPSFVSWFRLQCADADFAVAPLADTRFNRCKSDLKFLDYAAAGLAGIFSDVPSYRNSVSDGETGLLVPNTPERWEAAIAWMIEHRSDRRRIAKRAQLHVHSDRMLIDPGRVLQVEILALHAGRGQVSAPPPQIAVVRPDPAAGTGAGPAPASRGDMSAR